MRGEDLTAMTRRSRRRTRRDYFSHGWGTDGHRWGRREIRDIAVWRRYYDTPARKLERSLWRKGQRRASRKRRWWRKSPRPLPVVHRLYWTPASSTAATTSNNLPSSPI